MAVAPEGRVRLIAVPIIVGMQRVPSANPTLRLPLRPLGGTRASWRPIAIESCAGAVFWGTSGWRPSWPHRPPGNGCPYCGNRKVLEGFNDIATTHPHIAAQASGWDPTTVIRKRSNGEHGAVTMAMNGMRLQAIGSKGRVASSVNRQVLKGFDDSATTHPALAAQAHKWDPSTVVSGSKARRLWQCDRGHEWEARVHERARRNIGCPRCANRPVATRHGSLVVEHPEVAVQAVRSYRQLSHPVAVDTALAMQRGS